MQTCICSFCSHQNRAQAHYCGDCGRPLHFHDLDSQGHILTHSRLEAGTLLGSDGRYIIRDLIGGGAFSEAYLAEDSHHWQRLCLIKRLRIKADTQAALIPSIRTNFEREARLLVALGHPGHQNIPDIYEYLPDERCLVMKYITGKSLDRVLKRQIAPLSEEEALRYIRDACAALCYMHAHGVGPILHRDLKPSNIMLDTTGRVFLIDFGLAHDQLAPGIAADWGGTYGYMAPEQDRGQPEPRSDIYALGATLYELLTHKRPPHLGKNILPARTLNPALRPEVEQLIVRCMAPTVEQRPCAAELLPLLDDLLESAHIPAPPAAIPLPALPLTIGRESALQELEQILQDKHSVALLGMPGVGKTALAIALAHRYAQPEHVFWHRFHTGESVDLVITSLAGWLARRGYPAIWRQLQRQRQSGQLEMQTLQAEYLAQSPGMQNCLLCFDDVHTVAHNTKLEQLLTALRQVVGNGGLRMVLTTRMLPSFIDAAESMRIPGLDRSVIPVLLAQRGLELEEPIVERLWQLTEGNPQFLSLAIYAMQQATDPQSLLARLSETELIEHYLLHEVDAHLSDSERAVMSALAILLGHGSERAVIEALLDGGAVRRELAALLSNQLLMVEQHATGAIYYQHAIVQAFYYHLQGARQRQELHRRAAAYYAAPGRDRISAARHYAHADDYQQAATMLSTAPWQLFNQGHAAAVAEIAASIVLDALTPEMRAALLTAQSEALELLGDDEHARALVECALDIDTAEPAVRQARRYRLLARIYERHSEHERAEEYCRRGLTLALLPDGSQRRTEAARLYAQLAEILMRCDKRTEAMQACTAGLEALPVEPATPTERTMLLQRLATMAGEAGKYDQAIEALEQSLSVARQAGDVALTARVLHNLGLFYTYSGASERALPHLQESIRLKERLGDRSSTIDTLNVIGMAYLAADAFQTALHYFQTAREMAETYMLPASLAYCLHNLGQVSYDLGDFEAAQTHLLAASTMFCEAGETGQQAHSLSLLGDVAIAMGEKEAAYHYAQQALALTRENGHEPLEAYALRLLGEAELACGQLTAAEQALAQAWTLLETIGDPYDQALTRGAQARLAQAQGLDEIARSYAEQSLEIVRKHPNKRLELAMHALLQELMKFDNQNR